MPKATWKDEVLAESEGHEVVEGNVYFPSESLRREHFRPSEKTTTCPWKGEAHYYDIVVGDETNRAAAWYYPEPKPKAEKIRGMVAFWRGVQVLSLLGLLALAAPIAAQEAETPAPVPCSGPGHRQFDFWVGEWNVTRPDGQPAGTNRITSILGGCVLHESWKAAKGPHAGQSFNIFGRDGRWHQTWVDNGGLLLELVGGLEAGRMVMGQDRTGPDGKVVRHEISWARMANGQVNQHWRSSDDGGQTWRDVFIGIYTRQ